MASTCPWIPRVLAAARPRILDQLTWRRYPIMAGDVSVKANFTPQSDSSKDGWRNLQPTLAKEREAAPRGPRTDPQLAGSF